MNYYPFHLGDYAAHTGHLEPMEDLAYRRLLDQYYLREGPLPADIQVTAKLVRMRSMAADVESVLKEFFALTDFGWVHSRCDAEIEKMQDKQAKARASGIASANARKSYAERVNQAKPTDVEGKPTNVEQTLCEMSTDVQLPTPTPTPTPTPEKKDIGSAVAELPTKTVTARMLTAEGVDKQSAEDWLTLRKAKRLPLTHTAWADTKAEGEKVGLCPAETVAHAVRSNWAGFKAAWYAKDNASHAAAPMFAGAI
jgi:uncharacterized protein YdaU (DUF1376 family)